MSTNHNRIRVADLETNEPNKILKTNQNGELEFSDTSNLQVESYNALDYITEGKTLDARQGKILKDMIDNVNKSTVSLVNDLTTGGTTEALTAEMGKQLNEIKHPCEDQRLSQDQTVKFGNVIVKDGKYSTNIACYEVKSQNTETYFSTKLTPDAIIAQSSDARKLEVKYNSINFIGDPYTDKKGSLQTHFLTGARSWYLQDKDGIVALTNDYVVTAPGTNTRPSLIIPNGILNTTPQNGAIERDSTGELYHVVNGVRYKISDNRDYNNFLSTTWRSTSVQNSSVNTVTDKTGVSTASLPSSALGSSDKGQYLFKTFDSYILKNGSYKPLSIPPKSILFEVYLKGNNCKFTGNQYVKLYSVLRTDINTTTSIRNYEIPLFCSLIQGVNYYSSIKFSEKNFDNLGNIASETTRDYSIQSLSYKGATSSGDMKFSDASISIEYRTSIFFEDPTNVNEQNALCYPIFSNYSSMFLKV